MTQATDNAPQLEEWQNRTLADLIQCIVARHHMYLREEFPAIETLLRDSAQNRSDQPADSLAALIKTFRQFRRGMEEHMKKEEAILFPMIEKIESARGAGREPPRLPFGSIGHPIAVMEQEHEQARKELAEIRTLTSDYTTVPTEPGEQASMLERLKALDADMEIHSRLEDEVLFPRAIGLERI
ncbi:MAG: hemerythrin domain-containing protein [Bryobacteraceae bacterium]